MATPDFNRDGQVTGTEIELQLKLEKAEQQAFIAKVALFAMIGVIVFILSPWGPTETLLTALDATLSTFFIAMASVVGAFMGFTAWMSRDRSSLRSVSYQQPTMPDDEYQYAVYRTPLRPERRRDPEPDQDPRDA